MRGKKYFSSSLPGEKGTKNQRKTKTNKQKKEPLPKLPPELSKRLRGSDESPGPWPARYPQPAGAGGAVEEEVAAVLAARRGAMSR